MRPHPPLPVFEENQVLSAEHLNRLSAFLREADLQTRRVLIGAGVVHGLNVTRVASGLRLSRGAALTTDGHLCHVEADESFAFARAYTDPASYSPFLRDTGSGPAQIDLWEAVRATDPDDEGVQSLTGPGAAAFLNDKAALLYLEAVTADLDRCIGNHCINQGQELRFTWRLLLGRREDLAAIRSAALSGATLYPAWELAERRPERLLLTSADVLSHAALLARGTSVIQSMRDSLRPPLENAIHLYSILLETSPTLVNRVQAGIGSEFDDTLARLRNGTLSGWQYLYDHLRHLHLAWDAFIESAFAWRSEPAPLREAFPLHVLLGEIPTRLRGRPSDLRHVFVPSPALTIGGTDRTLCQQRFERLLSMAGNFGIPAASEVRITPGRHRGQPLDAHAVPFYYAVDAVLPAWSAAAAARGHERRLPCYHREALDPAPHVQDPLRYHDEHADFYRIEGHQGRPRVEVERRLAELREQYNLAFDVVTVTFGRSEAEREACLCMLKELETAYAAGAAEMRCHLERLLSFLSRLLKPARNDLPIVATVSLANQPKQVAIDVTKLVLFHGATAPDAGSGSPSTAAGSANAPSRTSAASTSAREATRLQRAKLNAPFVVQYAELASNVLSLLNPVDRANQIAQELVGRLTDTEELLSVALPEFDAAAFEKSVAAARSRAASLKDVLNRLRSGDVANYEPTGEEAPLVDELVIFLANCVPRRLLSIASAYAEIVGMADATPTLASFLRKHPGLEHIGGVPKGGTFVLVVGTVRDPRPGGTVVGGNVGGIRDVLVDAAASRGTASSSRLGGISSGMYTLAQGLVQGGRLPDDQKVLLGDLQVTTAEPPRLTEEFWRDLYERLRDRFDPQSPTARTEVVLADFCLPYLCCSECTCSTTVIVQGPPEPPPTIRLPRYRFCSNDPEAYPLIVTPPGGTAAGPGESVRAVEGGWEFVPGAAGTAGDIQLVYTAPDGRTAEVTVTLQEPPDASFQVARIAFRDDGIVVAFENTSPIDVEGYAWTFGDPRNGTAQTRNPAYVYAEPGEYTVTLEVRRGECRSRIEQTITLARPPAPSIDVEGEGLYCARDRRNYRIEVSPTGGEFEGEGLGVVSGQTVFIPALVQMGEAESRTVRIQYRAPDGQVASEELRLIRAPEPAFEAVVRDLTSRTAIIDFRITSTREGVKYQWDFGEGPVEDPGGDSFQREVPITPNTRSILVQLEATRDPCPPVRVQREIFITGGVVFDPGAFDRLRGSDRFTVAVGDALAELTSRVDSTLRDAVNDPAAAEALGTEEGEARLGRDVSQALEQAAERLRAAPNLQEQDASLIWQTAEIALVAGLSAVALRRRDLTQGGPLSQALLRFSEQIRELRQVLTERRLSFNPTIRSFLQRAEADRSAPVLQEAAKALNAALPATRRRAEPSTSEPRRKSAKRARGPKS